MVGTRGPNHGRFSITQNLYLKNKHDMVNLQVNSSSPR